MGRLKVRLEAAMAAMQDRGRCGVTVEGGGCSMQAAAAEGVVDTDRYVAVSAGVPAWPLLYATTWAPGAALYDGGGDNLYAYGSLRP